MTITATANHDDFGREVYCILGIAIDAVDMPTVLQRLDAAASRSSQRFFLSTPNLNFLVTSQTDPEFRESVLESDLCPPDGMPIVWIARILGIPIKHRIAGSDIFEALKAWRNSEQPLKISFFGSTERVASAAAERVNREHSGLQCVSWACPGFGSLDEMSRDHFIDRINASGAHFLVAALGARNGQLWLQRNRHRLSVPIRAHLGTTINFQAGTVKRAPLAMRRLGLEWLWRIKEEPSLFGRYWHDGLVLLKTMITRLPLLAIAMRRLRWRASRRMQDFSITRVRNSTAALLQISGYATARHVAEAIAPMREAIEQHKPVVIDLSDARGVDARFFGLLLMLRKQLKSRGCPLAFTGVSLRLQTLFRLNGLGYLLQGGAKHDLSIAV